MAKLRRFRKFKTLKKFVNDKNTSMLEAGKAVTQYITPYIKLRWSIYKKESAYDKTYEEIIWRITEGLTILFHEIGHAVLDHYSDILNNHSVVWEEADAWRYAEDLAHKLGIKFDYELAERYFYSYYDTRKLSNSLQLKWRYR